MNTYELYDVLIDNAEKIIAIMQKVIDNLLR